MATKATENDEVQDTAGEGPDGPLLDLSDAAVKRMIKLAKKRGYVTYDELNEVLPSDQNSSDQIEDIYAMLSDMGINVVDSEEAEEAPADDNAAEEEGEVAESTGTAVAKTTTTREPTDRTDDPCACTCARWARWSCSSARAKSPSPSASRLAARR
jgi:RNA polymerase, sigma 70 subunit, RpoD